MHLQKSLSIYVRIVVCVLVDFLQSYFMLLAIFVWCWLYYLLWEKKLPICQNVVNEIYVCGARVAILLYTYTVFIVPPCHLFAFTPNTLTNLFDAMKHILTDLFGIWVFSWSNFALHCDVCSLLVTLQTYLFDQQHQYNNSQKFQITHNFRYNSFFFDQLSLQLNFNALTQYIFVLHAIAKIENTNAHFWTSNRFRIQ